MNCPCGTGKNYAECCQVYHLGAYPDTAEQLMRSRYSAYALRDAQYLIKTHLIAEKDKEYETQELVNSLPIYEWLELKVINTSNGQKHDKEGTVEFIAKNFSEGQISEIKENSYFRKIGPQWYYINALD